MNAAQRRVFRRAHAIVPGATVKRQTSKGVHTVARVLSVDTGKHAVIVKRKDNQRVSWGVGEILRAMGIRGPQAVSA